VNCLLGLAVEPPATRSDPNRGDQDRKNDREEQLRGFPAICSTPTKPAGIPQVPAVGPKKCFHHPDLVNFRWLVEHARLPRDLGMATGLPRGRAWYKPLDAPVLFWDAPPVVTSLSRSTLGAIGSLLISRRCRCRENMAHIRQSRPDSGLGFQVHVPTTF